MIQIQSMAAAAYASLVSLMHIIHDLQHHPFPPISLDKQLLDSITQRVTYFQEFLHSYNTSPPPDDDQEEAVDPLGMRIAAAAHAAEDAIEYHIVDFIKQKRDNNTNDADEKIKSINRCVGILQTVIEEMDSIKKLVVLVDTQTTKQKQSLVNVVLRDHVDVVPASNETLVGSDGVLLEIMEKLAGGQLDLRVIPIVGMGGIGKTFLAKTIYTKPFVKERFDICAWATISQSYDAREILSELLSQATNTNKEQLSADELGLKLHKHLFSRRFLIVMDDMWSIDSWDTIQRFFPNNDNGSRVLVTTRLSQLSLQLNNDYSLNMSFLDKDSSWDLFSKTVFDDKSSCPPELVEIGEKIVDNCRGLPLSIAVVGGLLKNMESTRASWESIRDNFTSVVNMNNDKHCLKLLKLSYNHLPVYLKPCFLYMGVFKEDKKIRVAMLVRLWVSEGFLRPTNGETLETTARGFLQDLVDRNLILIGKLGPTGSLKSCKIHDLVRDMCLNESQKEGFYHVIEQSNNPPLPRCMNTHRRVVISKVTSKEKVCGDLRSMSHTRSIISDHGDVALSQNLALLRTLHAFKKHNSVSNDKSCILESLVYRYVNLRHLAINASIMQSSYPSFSPLWNLQTLIVSHSLKYESPLLAELWKMPQFRHIEFVTRCAPLPDPPSGDAVVVVMENLHTLKGIWNFKCSEEVVKRIPNIKKLKLNYDISNIGDDDDMYLEGNIKNLYGLEILLVNYLTSIRGPITHMQFITFPHSLKKLSLCMEHGFEWLNVMLEKMGSLPLLEELKLSKGRFLREEWEIAQGEFPSLKYLELDYCWGLKNWRTASSSSFILPRLEHLKLAGLQELEKLPFEIGNIDTLKVIEVICCGVGAVKSVKEMFDEQVELEGGEDQLSFHVVVKAFEWDNLVSLAGPKFSVNLLM